MLSVDMLLESQRKRSGDICAVRYGMVSVPYHTARESKLTRVRPRTLLYGRIGIRNSTYNVGI